MKLEDPDEKYKRIDDYSQNKAKKWLEDYVNGLNGVTPKMITDRGPAYKRASKNAIKKAQSILYREISDTYEIFHGNWLSFEYFKVDDPVEKLWERFIEYAKWSTQNNNLSISDDIKKSICSDFVKHLEMLIKIVEKYDTFFHKLVYHMRYKEHVSDSGKIAICEIMNAKYTKNVLSVLVKKYKISNTRIYKIWRGQEYYAGLTFKVDQNQNIDWDKEIESIYDLYAELPPESHQSITNPS
ncbi:12062_t:CDS:2 [Entrophospora sp. SA101]|nr:12062_t:CDS:2 [Entrophospora sp. SA101]